MSVNVNVDAVASLHHKLSFTLIALKTYKLFRKRGHINDDKIQLHFTPTTFYLSVYV